ncbi:MAG TPA: amidohydrolase family protein [Longimicrobiales bacterium]|nr:amidohydrolase family protein [Longimicrobiales bacterium]
MHPMRTALAALLLTALIAPRAFAQQEPIAIRAARMLDVRSGRMVRDALVVVRDGRIAQVGGSVPAGATVVQLGDATLMPGWIDTHVHLTGETLSPTSYLGAVRETALDDALRGVANARRTVEAGFTTVRNVGGRGFADIALARAIERGDVVGPRIVAAGHSLSITGGHCDETGWAPGILELGVEQGVADGVDEVLEAVRYQIKHGAGVIKICATAGVLSFEGPVGAQQFSEEEMRAAVEEAARHGLRVAAHAHGTEGIKAAVRAGVASIEHGSMLDDEAIRMMRERGTFLVPTQYLSVPILEMDLPEAYQRKAREVVPLMQASFRRAVRAGVRIAFGTDAGVYPHGDNAREFAVYVDAGMSPLEALRSATIHAAELLGVADRGAIAEGLLADLVAVPGNPLDDIRVTERPTFVMVGGSIVKQGE